MEHRPFGQTGLQVSAIGDGCWEIDAILARHAVDTTPELWIEEA